MHLLRLLALSLTLLLGPAVAAANAADPVLISSPGALGTLPDQRIANAGPPESLKGNDVVSTSDDGRYAVFGSQSDGLSGSDDDRFVNVFRKDRTTGVVTLISQNTGSEAANGSSYGATISDDGNLVAFTSSATNLAAGDTDPGHDVYVRNVSTNTTTLVSPGAAQDCEDGADADCGQAMISGDGQYVAFASDADKVAADANGKTDVYRATVAGATLTLVSQVEGSAPARAGNGSSYQPSIDDSGAHVAFTTSATDLAAAPTVTDANGTLDVFVRTMTSGDQRLVTGVNASQSTTLGKGGDRPMISGDGLKVAFATDSNGVDPTVADTDSNADVYLRVLSTNVNALITRQTGVNGTKSNSYIAEPLGLSDDGEWILFTADASNLGVDTNGIQRRRAVYARRYIPTLLGTTIPVSVGPNGPSDAAVVGAISGNAARVLIISLTPLDDAVTRDEYEVYGRALAPLGTARLVSRPPGDEAYVAQDVGAYAAGYYGIARRTSADGRYVVFASGSDGLSPDDRDDKGNVYRRDLRTGAIDLISRATGPDGAGADGGGDYPSISADGNRVAFTSYAGNLGFAGGTTRVYVRDVAAGTTTLASRLDGPGGADEAGMRSEISGDGRRVVYLHDAGGTSHVMVRDLEAGTTTQADRADGAAGTLATAGASTASIDATGTRVAFTSGAKNLEGPGTDTDVNSDAYVRDLAAGTTRLVSRADGVAGAKSTSAVYGVEISLDGGRVAFSSSSAALAPETWGVGVQQLFVRDLAASTTVLASRGTGVADDGVGDFTIDGTGDRVAFVSEATTIVPGAGTTDTVFVRRLSTGETTALPAWKPADPNNQDANAGDPSLSADGRCLAFLAEGVGPVAGVSSDYGNAYVLPLDGGTCPGADAVVPPDVPKVDPPKNPPPNVAPKVSRLKLSHAKFKVGKKATPAAARATAASAAKKEAAKKKTPEGTTIGFTLSAKAAVAITVEARTTGRLNGKRCVKATRKLAKKKKCVLYAKTGTLKRASVKAGAVKVAFTGRIGKKALKPGTYRITVVATAAGKSSAPVRASFTVVKK